VPPGQSAAVRRVDAQTPNTSSSAARDDLEQSARRQRSLLREHRSYRTPSNPQTIMAYAMNGQPLPVPHGAPLRLRVERQAWVTKMAKYVMRIEAVEDFAKIGFRVRAAIGKTAGLRMVCRHLDAGFRYIHPAINAPCLGVCDMVRRPKRRWRIGKGLRKASASGGVQW